MNQEPEYPEAIDVDDDADGAEGAASGGSAMGFFDHLDALRAALFKSVVAFFAWVAVVCCWLVEVSTMLEEPLRSAGFEGKLKNIEVMGSFGSIVQIAIVAALPLSLPFIVFFLGQFLAPALTRRELRLLVPGLGASLLLFVLGAAFSFFLLVPASLRMDMQLNQSMGWDVEWTADSYYGFITWMVLLIGLCFEFPLILLTLVRIGMLRPSTLGRFRRHAFVGFLVLSAVVTPTQDPVTFLILAIPLYVLYELSIWVGCMIERKRDAEIEDDEA